MSRTWWVARLFERRATQPRRVSLRPQVTTLEDHTTPAVTGAVAGGTLTVSLDAAGDQAFLRVDATGKIELSGDNFTTQVSGSPFASIDRVVVQDTTVGGGANQTVRFIGAQPFLLANGLQSSGVETVDFEQPIKASAGAGGIDVAAPQSVLVNADLLTATGNITVQAAEGPTASINNVTVSAGTTVRSAGGNILFQAGDDLIINGTLSAPAGNITLESGAGDTDGEGAQTLNGAISASTASGRVTINLNGQQGANQTGGSITAHDLLLLGAGTAGTFSLKQSNDVTTIAANVSGAISYSDTNDLTIDTIAATNGITTNNAVATLSAGGNLILAQPVKAGTAAINLSAGGGITQSVAGIQAAADTVTLTAPAGIGTAAQRLSVNTSDLTTDTTGGNGNQFLQNATGLSELNLNAGAGDIDLSIAGAGSILSGDAATDITGGTVTVALTAGSFGANNTNAGNAIETSVSNLNISAPGGAIFIRESSGVTLTNLSATGGTNGIAVLSMAGDVTVNTVSAPGNVSITTTAGSILDDGNNATAITGDMVTLTASGEIGQPGPTADIDTTANSWTLAAGDASGLTKGIWARDADAIAVNSATTTDGTIILTAGGTMTANAVAANNVAASQNMVLTTTAGDILLGAVSATGSNPGSVRISAAGAVVDNNAAAVNVTATGLALQATTGIGSADALETRVAKVAAFSNTGDIQVINTGGLTIGSVGPIAGVTVVGVNGSGQAVITAASPLIVAADVLMVGDITLTASETNDAPAFADDVTITAGMTVRSTGGNVILHAGDDANLQAGSTVKSDTGSVAIVAGFGDLDGRGGAILGGTILGNPVTVAALDDICVGTLNLPGAAVSLTSVNGSILDCNDVPSGTPVLNITADSLSLSAKHGIGVPSAANGVNPVDAPLEVDVATLHVTNSGAGAAGDIQVIDIAGGVTVSGGNTAPGGNVAITALGGGVLTVIAGNLTSAGGNIILSADDMTITGTLNAGAGIVTLQQAGTTPRDIDLGTITAGKLSFTDAVLDTITARVLRIGRMDNPGNLVITNQITQAGSGYGALSLRAGGAIQNGVAGVDIVGTSLALQAGMGIGSNGLINHLETQVTNLAAVNAISGAVQINNTGDVVVGKVDGISGLSSTNAAIDLNDTGGSGNVTINNAVNAGAGSVTIRAPGAGNTLTNNAAIANSGGSPIVMMADRMALAGGTITALGGGRITLRSVTPGELIGLGSTTDAAANTLELSGAELATITTPGVLQIGDATAGDITLTAAVAPTSLATLSLQTSGGVTQNAGATITTPSLAIRAVSAVALTEANNITTGVLAAKVTAAGQGVAFTDANGLTVGSADGVSGITTNNGTITLTAGAGNLTLNNNITAGTAPISLRAGGANSLLTNAAAITGSSATLTADRMSLAGGTINVGTGAANIVSLQPDSAGRLLDLGSATDAAANALELSDAELHTITAGVLRIGRSDASVITISAAITAPAGYSTLHLLSAGAITETGSGSLAVNRLAVEGSDVALAGSNAVALLAGSAKSGGFTFVNALDLTVDAVDKIADVTTGATNGGDITLRLFFGGKVLTLLQAVTSGTGAVNLIADDMAINAVVSALNPVNGFVRVRTATSAHAIDVGTNTPGTLGLSVAEFGNLIGRAGVQIGDMDITGVLVVSQPITLAGTIGRLDLDSAYVMTINGAIVVPGGNVALRSADISVNQNLSAAGTITLTNSNLTNSAPLRLNKVSVSGAAGVSQDGTGPVILIGDAQVTSTAGAVSFAGTIDGTTAGTEALSINAAGSVALQQSVGQTTRLESLFLAGSAIHLGGADYRTALNQSYNAPVAVSAPAVLFESAGGTIGFANTLSAGGTLVTVSAANGGVVFQGDVGSSASPLGSIAVTAKSITMNAVAVSTTGSQEYAGPVVVGSGTTFHSLGTGAIAFDSTLDGPGAASVVTGGLAVFQGAVGGTTPLAALVTQAALGATFNGGLIRTELTQSYVNPVSVGADTTFQSLAAPMGDINFWQSLTGTSAVAVLTGSTTRFQGAVSLGSLTTDAPGVTSITTSSISTTQGQVFGDEVVVEANATFTAGAEGITFGGGLFQAGSIAVVINTGGATTFSGPVHVASLTTDAPGTTVVNTASITTDSALTLGDATTFNVATTFTAGSDAFFGSTLTSAGLSGAILSPGTTTLNGAVNVGSLTTDAPGTTRVNGGSVITSAAQFFGDPVTIGADTRFASSGRGAVTFAQTLAGGHNVTVNTGGATTFVGTIALGSLTTDAGGTTQLNGGRVDTTGSQAFGDPVGLGAATTFTAGQSVVFGGSLSGGVAVVVNAPGTTRFGGIVQVASLVTDAPGQTVVGGGSIRTSGGQSFSDSVVVTAGAIFTAGGDVQFTRDLSGGFAVTVNNPATTTFGGPVNIGSLATDAGGRTIVRGGSVATGSNQQYGDDVLLGANTRLSATSGNLLFTGRLDSEDANRRQLTAAAPTGNIQFNGAVGGANQLDRLLIENAHDVTIDSTLRAGVVIQSAGSGTTAINGATTITDAGGIWLNTKAIHFAADVNATSDMGLLPQGGGVTQTAGTINVSSLELDGFGDIQLDQPNNDIRGVLRANRGGGTVHVADRNDLTIDNVRGFTTQNGDVFLSAGQNFTASEARTGDARYSTPMIQLGSGQFIVRPGLTAGANILFDMEAAASLVSLGVADGGNNADDQFTVRPSATTPIDVFGNLPGTPLRPGQHGDRLFPFLAGLSVTQFQFDGQNGFYAFTNRAKLSFAGIDSLQKLALSGFVVQTGEPQDATGARQVQYAVRIVRSQDGVPLPGGLDGSALLQNPFVVSPALVNPISPNSAPRIAFGDVNGDGAPDLILAGGSGTAPLITVVDGRAINAQNGQLPRLDQLPPGQILAQFYAYDPRFLGGVNVAVGDFDHDGLADIVTGADVGGGPHVRIFSGKSLMAGTGPQTIDGPLGNFFAYEPTYTGGVRVAVGDVNGDGKPDLVLGAGIGGGPRVTVLDGATGGTLANFFAYDPAFRGGIYVDAGNYDTDGDADILTGAGDGGPHVRVFSGKSAITGTSEPTGLASFFAFPPTEQTDPLFGTSISMSGVGGVAFTSGSQSGSRNILVGTARGPKVRVTEFEGNGQTPTNSVDLLDEDQFHVQGVNPTTQVANPVILPLPTLIGYGATVAGFADLTDTTPGTK